MLDINQIKAAIPHRFPFLLIDRIIELEKGKRAVGIKNVTADDFFSQSGFTETGVYPGALQVEAMAQVAGFVLLDLLDQKEMVPLFGGIEYARFRKSARPGDQLRFEVNLSKFKIGTGKFEAKAYIGNELASEASFTCVLGMES